MKNAYWAYWLVLLGIAIVVIMMLVQSLVTTSTQDYYVVKEITDAALVDSIDFSYYRTYGEIRIQKEKFFESFLRRFAETASLNTTYTVSFYGIYEAPPKVSVEIKSKSNSFSVMGDATTVDMVERIDGILEGAPIEKNDGANESNNNSSHITNSNNGSDDAINNNNANTNNSTSEQKLSIEEYIKANACDMGYYDCSSGKKEITTYGNINAFACQDYISRYNLSNEELEKCKKEMPSIYEKLPKVLE